MVVGGSTHCCIPSRTGNIGVFCHHHHHHLTISYFLAVNLHVFSVCRALSPPSPVLGEHHQYDILTVPVPVPVPTSQ